MAEPPRDRSEFWIRFVCGFFFFGLLSGFSMAGISVEFQKGLMLWAVITLSASVYVAKVGDQGWVRLCNLFKWY